MVSIKEIHDIFRITVQPYLEKRRFYPIDSITKKNLNLPSIASMNIVK